MFLVLVLVFFFFGRGEAAPTAYGSSQVRDQIRAAAAIHSHSHSNTRSELHLRLCRSSRQHRIFNPENKARDRTHILVVTSQALKLLSHNGTPVSGIVEGAEGVGDFPKVTQHNVAWNALSSPACLSFVPWPSPRFPLGSKGALHIPLPLRPRGPLSVDLR